MEEPQQNRPADEEATVIIAGEEATLVSPRFDDEETLVARPVVPLEEAGDVEAVAGEVAPMVRAARTRPSYAPRRSWVLATVLVSVLVGGVLGGAGLYIYQRQSNDDAASPREQSSTGAQQQPAPAPNAEASNAPPAEAQAPSEPPATGTPADEQTSAPTPAPGATEAPAAREPEQVPAAVRRDAGAGAPKRGKKGERDEELERPAPRAASERPAPRADVAAEREARRVDTIVYRPRRAPRRERARRETAGDTDRLRRIFEGMPE